MSKIEIFDNLIPENEQIIIKSLLSSDMFPWYYNSQTIRDSLQNRSQFTHTFYKENSILSDNFDILLNCFNPYISEFKTHCINKMKANLNIAHSDRKILNPHVDLLTSGITYLYYVNDSDGPTRFYESKWNNKKIYPKQGRIVRFPSNMLHTGDVPRKHDRRMVINIIFE
jgi:hypothetical protein